MINSGQMGIGLNGETFQAVLGSCVAVCIYDRKLQFGGLIHYLLPSRNVSHSSLDLHDNPLNFGDLAIALLLKEFKSRGSERKNLQVCILGGGRSDQVRSPELQVGAENVRIAKETLRSFGLTIHKELLGLPSTFITFNTVTGQILVDKKLKQEILPPRSENLTRVLIVDDSETIRKVIRTSLEQCSYIQVVGEARDAAEAEKLRTALQPDVMTLELHIPGKNGVEYVGDLLRRSQMPVVIVSDLSLQVASPVMRALELGAFDYLQKPMFSDVEEFTERLQNVVMEAKRYHDRVFSKKLQPAAQTASLTPSSIKSRSHESDLIAIGASTGGVEAIRYLFRMLPAQTPPIVIVQHIPHTFSAAFADGLDRHSQVRVLEACDGDVLEPNTAYIAPGGKQMKLKERNGNIIIQITDDAPVNRFKPSVDYLFGSIARLTIARKTKAVLLTGMGDDGAKGLLALRNAGSLTIAQGEESCVVYGMPKAAIEIQAAVEVLELSEIGHSLVPSQKKSVKYR